MGAGYKCQACGIHDAELEVRIIGKTLCRFCYQGKPVNGVVYQSTDWSVVVVQ
jgi:hypothetical protein